MSVNVLVTGALGFVGLNCVYDLAPQVSSVIALSRREPDAQSLDYVRQYDNVHWRIADVTDTARLQDIIEQEGVSHILHAAAMTATADQEKTLAARMFAVNAGATLNILELAREAQLARVVFVSSSGIYGPAPPLPLKDETDPLQIGGMYAICKQTSEHLCRRYRELYGLSTVVGRLGTAYGPMERASKSRRGMSAVHQLVQVARQQDHINVHGASIARDFCHIEDVAKAFSALLLAPSLQHALYNVAAAQAYPLLDALQAISEVKPDWHWEEVAQEEAADVVQTAANARAGMSIARLQADTSWRPSFDLKAGVLAYWRWLQH